MLARHLAVVGAVDDQGALGQLRFVQACEDPADQ